MYYGEYVSVAQQRKKAEKLIQKLRKQGDDINPIEAFSGKIGRSFWGKSWCDNLEHYADEAYRLERGRRYVRAGSICDLEITEGNVKALVSGTRPYRVAVKIAAMQPEKWQNLCKKCANHIGSLLEILKGDISKEVMEIVCDRHTGLFPQLAEIKFSCSCPDHAVMCKHVAAVLYGIGRRLDERPDLLFVLRNVDPAQLAQAGPEISDTSFDKAQLENIFGIELDMDESDPDESQPVESGADVEASAVDKNAAPGKFENQANESPEDVPTLVAKPAPARRQRGKTGRRKTANNKEARESRSNHHSAALIPDKSESGSDLFAEEIRKLSELRRKYLSLTAKGGEKSTRA